MTGYCDACGAGPGVVCDPFCTGVAAEQDEEPCKACQDAPGHHAGLHVGHLWTAVSCPAYRTLKGQDCTCQDVPTCVECDSPSIYSTVKGRPYCFHCGMCLP